MRDASTSLVSPLRFCSWQTLQIPIRSFVCRPDTCPDFVGTATIVNQPSVNTAEASQLVDLGAGWGRAMWHASVAVRSLDPPNGVESNERLVSEADRISDYILSHLPRDYSQTGSGFNKPVVGVLDFHQLTSGC